MKSRAIRASGVRETSDPNARPLVVLAEDDEGIQWALTEALMDAGFDVIAVAAVEKLRKVLDEQRPDVLLADYQLLDDTTESVVTELVAKSAMPRVVVVSAAPAARTLAERLAVPHLAKPFELDDLIAVVVDARTTAA